MGDGGAIARYLSSAAFKETFVKTQLAAVHWDSWRLFILSIADPMAEIHFSEREGVGVRSLPSALSGSTAK